MNLKVPVITWALVSFLMSASSHAQTTVVVRAMTPDGISRGTGFVISSQGDVVTCYHVIANARSIEIIAHGRHIDKYPIVTAISQEYDLAKLRVTLSDVDLDSFRLPNATPKVVKSEYVRVLANFKGLESNAIEGQITSDGLIESRQLVQDHQPIFAKNIEILPLDITVYDGMSGAPVIADNKEVLGVLSGSLGESRGLAWAIPIRYLAALKPLNKHPEEVLEWPPLTLMNPRWKSFRGEQWSTTSRALEAFLENIDTMESTYSQTSQHASFLAKPVRNAKSCMTRLSRTESISNMLEDFYRCTELADPFIEGVPEISHDYGARNRLLNVLQSDRMSLIAVVRKHTASQNVNIDGSLIDTVLKQAEGDSGEVNNLFDKAFIQLTRGLYLLNEQAPKVIRETTNTDDPNQRRERIHQAIQLANRALDDINDALSTLTSLELINWESRQISGLRSWGLAAELLLSN